MLVAGCGPKIDSADPQERLRAIQQESKQSRLAWVAHADPVEEVRLAAVAQITSNEELLHLARRGVHAEVRLAAVRRITDAAVLEEVARLDQSQEIQLAAVDRLTDDDRLFSVAWDLSQRIDPRTPPVLAASEATPSSPIARAISRIRSPEKVRDLAVHAANAHLRAAAQARMSDQDQAGLTAVAKNDAVAGLRLAAVRRVTDQTLLAQLAADADDPLIRQTAVAAVVDLKQLQTIATGNADWRVRVLALQRTTDQSLLARAAAHDPAWAARRTALDRLDDQTLLAAFARDCTELDFARAAVARLHDNALLMAVAKRARYWGARAAAAAKLQDEDELAALVLNDESWAVRAAALARLAKADRLEHVARASRRDDVRLAVIPRLENPVLLAEFAMSDRAGIVGTAAIERLADHAALARIAAEAVRPDLRTRAKLALVGRLPENHESLRDWAKSRDDYAVACAAVARITDQPHLLDIAHGAAIEQVRALAVAGLTDQQRLLEFVKRRYSRVVRESAVAQLTDPAILEWLIVPSESNTDVNFSDAGEVVAKRYCEIAGSATIAAFLHRDIAWHTRLVVTKYIADAQLLHALAGDDDSEYVRRAAIDRLSDPAGLADLARNSTHAEDRVYAGKRLVRVLAPQVRTTTDRQLLEDILTGSGNAPPLPDGWDKEGSTFRFSEHAQLQSGARARLAELSREENTPPAPAVAVVPPSTEAPDEVIENEISSGTSEPAQLFANATIPARLPQRVAAAVAYPDRTLLHGLAVDEPAASARLHAIRRVLDEAFLFSRAERDLSAAVRQAAMDAMREPALLATAAIEAYGGLVRETCAAAVTDPLLVDQIKIARQALAEELRRIEQKLDPQADVGELVTLAVAARFDEQRFAAVRRISMPADLARVAAQSQDRDVTRLVLARLESAEHLLEVADRAVEASTQNAAAIKAGRTTWTALFAAATAPDAPPAGLGNVLGALTLLPHQPEATGEVSSACLTYIRRGDEIRVPELVDLLEDYGDKHLAEDYLNCGQPDLDAAAHAWAARRGYTIMRTGGSSRAQWGSSR